MEDQLDWSALDGLLREPHLRRLSAISQTGSGLVLVGGAIRDALLGRVPQDVDLITEDDLEAVIDAVERERGARPASIGDDFQNTHRFRWHGRAVDIAGAIGPLEDDLARRDFTINAMALRLPVPGEARGTLIDLHGGLDDLRAGRLVPVSDAGIAADPLRVMRGVRYAGNLAGFSLSNQARATLRANAPALESVAAERLSIEWQAILASKDWVHALDLAWRLGAGTVTLGERRSDAGARGWAAHEARIGVVPEDRLVARLAALLFDLSGGDEPESLAASLTERRWPKQLARTAARAACWANQRGAAEEALARLALLDPAAATIAGQLAFAVGAGAPSRLVSLAERASEPRWVTGEHLQRQGMEPGPEMGRTLAVAAEGQVRRLWASADEALAWAATRSSERQ